MHAPWVGRRRIAVIPTIVDDASFDPAPADFAEVVRRRIFYDPDPQSGVDRSLRSYIFAVSYGRALLEADVMEPVSVPHSHCGAMQDDAIRTLPAGHGYEYACVVFPGGTHGCQGWAFYDQSPFPGTTNLRNWCYVSLDASLGVWAMETMHALTGFGDLYQTTDGRPGAFDNMDCSCGTHPSAFTKLKLGWLEESQVIQASSQSRLTANLHALCLLQPSPPGRAAAVRIPANSGGRYLLAEARLRLDPYERTTSGVSTGIPNDGVIVYEVNESVWAPLHLRAQLAPGGSYENQADGIRISVVGTIPGGFSVEVASSEHPDCPAIRQAIAEAEAEIRDLQNDLQHAAPAEKAAIVREIRRWQAVLRTEQAKATSLGCRH